MRILKALAMLLLLALPKFLSAAEIRAMWVLPWDLTSPQKIDQVIDEALAAGQTDLLVEVRYRSDALYTPNRLDSTFPNPEPRSYILADDGFDPLAYTLKKAQPKRLRVHAWVVAFNATPTHPNYLAINHIYRNHYEWITYDKSKRRMSSTDQFGYFIDPGIPAVQDYVLNVLCDLVSGYPQLDGLQLDYIRYPDTNLGYHPISVQRYENHIVQYGFITWNQWRTLQITQFVKKTYQAVKQINPSLILSAAVISNYYDATVAYAQDWKDWLEKGIVDCLYPMAYHTKLDEFAKQLDFMKSLNQDERIVVGLRAWDANGGSLLSTNRKAYHGYTVLDIVPRIQMIREHKMAGVALFSYDGLIKGRAIDQLARAMYSPQLLAEVDSSRDDFNIDVSPEDLQSNFAADIKMNSNGSMYVLSMLIPDQGSWIWELWDTGERLIYRRSRYYPKGQVKDYWNGFSRGERLVESGSYIVRVYPENGNYQYYIPVHLEGLNP